MATPSKNQATTTLKMWSNIHEAITVMYHGMKGLYGTELQERIMSAISEKDIEEIIDFLLSPDWEIKG